MVASAHIIATVLFVASAWPVSAASRSYLGHSFQPGFDDPVSPLCEGEPPELINEDDKAYEYQITCGKKTEQRSIGANSKQSLKGTSGCTLELGDNEATKLYADMVCTIEDAKLTCDLL